MNVDPATLSRQDVAELVNGLVAPRPIAWVSTIDVEGIVSNLAPFSFFNAFSSAPFTIGVGPGSRQGVHKDSLRNIKATGEFTVSLITEELAPKANRTSAEFSPEVDEWAVAGLTRAPSVVVAAPHVAESPGSLECRVFEIVDLGVTDVPTNSLVIARVVHVHVDDDVLDGYRPRPEALRLVGRMGGPLWVKTRGVFALKRPTVEEAMAGETVPTLARSRR